VTRERATRNDEYRNNKEKKAGTVHLSTVPAVHEIKTKKRARAKRAAEDSKTDTGRQCVLAMETPR